MLRLAGLIIAELAGERRFFIRKGAETRFLSQLLLFIDKKSWEDDGSGFVGNRADLSFAFTSRAGSISKLLDFCRHFVNTTTISCFCLQIE